MVDIEKLKQLDEKIKQDQFTSGCTGFCVDVYIKGRSFYESPRLIISTYVPSKYMREYRKCFDNNYIITQRNSTNVYVSDFTG